MDGYQMIPTWYHRGKTKFQIFSFANSCKKIIMKTQTDQEGEEGDSNVSTSPIIEHKEKIIMNLKS
jgi:hypothetical protein